MTAPLAYCAQNVQLPMESVVNLYKVEGLGHPLLSPPLAFSFVLLSSHKRNKCHPLKSCRPKTTPSTPPPMAHPSRNPLPLSAPVSTAPSSSKVRFTDRRRTLTYLLNLLQQDFHLIDLLAHFDRERIPEVRHSRSADSHAHISIKV